MADGAYPRPVCRRTRTHVRIRAPGLAFYDAIFSRRSRRFYAVAAGGSCDVGGVHIRDAASICADTTADNIY